MISAINTGNSTDCADPLISNDAADGLIATAVGDVSSMGCSEDAAGVFIDAINADNSMDCADITVSDDAVDLLITIAINDES